MLRLLTVLALLAATPAAAQHAPLMGVNLSGAEFGTSDVLRPTPADMNWYSGAAGFRLIRLPFKAARLMNPDGSLRMDRVREMQAKVALANARGVPVILDRHDFQWPAPIAQVEFWVKLLKHFPDNGLVWVDIMNEPKGFNDPVVTNDWMQWARDTNVIMHGLRKNGMKHRLLLEWPGYSAIFRFDKREPANKPCESAACAIDRSGGLRDPANNFRLSPHGYLNPGSSGTSAVCGRNTNILGFAQAARARRMRAVIGETAFGSYRGIDPSCEQIGPQMIREVRANADVFDGMVFWGGGRAWNDNYLFKIEPPRGLRERVAASAYLRMLTD